MARVRPFSAFFGIAVAACSIAAWTLCVNHLVKTVSVSQGMAYWMGLARTEVYDVCYDGCNDCLDVDSIAQACHTTTKVNVPGLICDASKMWTWDDRYPEECLEAVGNIFKENALWWKRFWLRMLHLLIVLALPLGLYAARFTDWLLSVLKRRLPNSKPRHTIRRRRSNSRAPLLGATLVALIAFSLPGQTSAYACMYGNPAYNQLFANADGTLYGVIHGWLSDCSDETYSCGESCPTSFDSNEKGGCSPTDCTRPVTNLAPTDYVRSAARRVKGCGFRLVDVVPGVVDKRIANPRIEGKLWVKVAVNRFNGSAGQVDEQVQCLYDMVDK